MSLLDYLYWITAAIVGAVLGGMITFDTTGLDFVLTALFVVLFMEQMKNHENYRYGVIGILASVAVVMLFGADNMVIPSMIMILVILLAGRRLETWNCDAGSER